MSTYNKLLLCATVVATMLGIVSAVSGKCGGNTELVALFADESSTPAGTFQFACGDGYSLKAAPDTIAAPWSDLEAMKTTCCDQDTAGKCGGNTASYTSVNWNIDESSTPAGTFQYACGAGYSLKANPETIQIFAGPPVRDTCCDRDLMCGGNPWSASTPEGFADHGVDGKGFTCSNGKHLKPNANAILFSGADTAAKNTVCCDDDVAGMCSGNTKYNHAHPLNEMSVGCTNCFYQFKCGAHAQLKASSATIAFSGATSTEQSAVCCDIVTPANAAYFDKCSTLTTRLNGLAPHELSETTLASKATFCGVGKEYDATNAESPCAAGKCNQNTAADVTACCKASTPCTNTDGTSANAAPCQCGNALWKCGASWNTPLQKEGLFCNAAHNMCGATANGVNSYSLASSVVPATSPRTFTKCSATTGTVVVMDINECFELSVAKGVGFAFEEIRSKDHPSGCSLQEGDRSTTNNNYKVKVYFNTAPKMMAAAETNFEMVCKAGTACSNTDGTATNVASCVCGEQECVSGSTCKSSESKCTFVNQAAEVVALKAEVAALKTKNAALEAKDVAHEEGVTALKAKNVTAFAKIDQLKTNVLSLEAKDAALDLKTAALDAKAIALSKQYDGIDKVCKGDADGRRLVTATVGCGGGGGVSAPSANSDADAQLSGGSQVKAALLAGAMALIITATMM